MHLTLSQQIALSLRNRPLVLPLLLATVFIDLLLLVVVEEDHEFIDYVLWSLLLPQLGLLAFWTSEGTKWWIIRFILSAAFVSAMSLLLDHDAPSVAALASILAIYYFVELLLGLGIRYLKWRSVRSEEPALSSPLRFTTWSLLVLMTIAAPIAAIAPEFVWEISLNELPLFLGMILMPIIARLANENAPRKIIGWGVTLGIGAALDVFSSINYPIDTFGWYVTQGVVCCLWLWAIGVQPDAKRRMAARRARREQRVVQALGGAEAHEIKIADLD